MDESVIYAQIDLARPALEYGEFRTGLCYADVYYMIYSRPHKRRHGVLGKWREIKLKMYDWYLQYYATAMANPHTFGVRDEHRNGPGAAIDAESTIPF